MLDLNMFEIEGNDIHGNPRIPFGFFKRLAEASEDSQAAVDTLLWPVLASDEFSDSKIKYAYLRGLAKYAWCSGIRVSVFTAPILDKECVKAILETALEKDWIIAADLTLLVERPEFDDELFYYAMDVFICGYASEAIRLLDLMADLKPLPLEWLVEVYYKSDSEAFEEKYYRNLTPEGETVWWSVEDFVLERICPYYPDMPEAWVKQMLKSLRMTGVS